VDHAGAGCIDVLTPDESRAHGCQLSLRIREAPEALFRKLRDGGIVGDFRPPDVIRVAPVPLYNTFHEIWQLGRLLEVGSRSLR
jgi:kynureninase